MTTSDDEPGFAETTHSDPLMEPDAGYDSVRADESAAAPRARWVPAILAALAVAVAGIAVWALIFAQAEREYVGVSVVIGLAIGWVLRVVSRRSTMAIRVVAVVLTAITIAVATLTAEVAYTVANFDVSTGTVIDQVLKNAGEIFGDKKPLTWVIFAAALVLAYLSASPQKPKAGTGAATATAAGGYAPGTEPEPYAADLGEPADPAAPPPAPPADAE